MSKQRPRILDLRQLLRGQARRLLNAFDGGAPRRPIRRPISRTLCLEVLEDRALLSTFTVLNTNNTGPGSLRQAILSANASPGLDTINFAIPGSGVQTIKPTSALPTITDAVVIDGTTQPGFSGKTLIQLDGSLAGNGTTGLLLTAGNSTVRGLVINNFSGTGLELNGGGGNLIEGNYIGTDATGTLARGNGASNFNDPGLLIYNSANNTIGGTTLSARNLISGNVNDGLDIEETGSTGNLVEGNYIGTDITGTHPLGYYDGVWIGYGASNNTIGGTTPGAGNLVSGNAGDGVQVEGSTSGGNVIQGNLIGTDATDTAPLPNGTSTVGSPSVGVRLEDAPNNLVGGTTAGAANVISGNTKEGVWIEGANATGNVVQGNFIGTDRTGTLNLANGLYGILFTDNGDGVTNIGFPSNNTVGGTVSGAGNTIAYNAAKGIVIVNGSSNAVQGNSIFANAGLGIDLGNDGVTANTGTRNAARPNDGMNFPVFTSATFAGATLTVAGYVGTAPGQAMFAGARIDLYKSSNDPSGHGQGQTYLGSLTADASGNFSGSLTVSGLSTTDTITATATDAASNSSEFAANASITAAALSASSTSVVSSLNPSIYGQAVTFTATVSAVAPATGTPTGTVTFLEGATTLGTATLSGGQATFTTSALVVGSHGITASYGGDSIFLPSTSAVLTQKVTPATLTVTANSASKVYGQPNPAFSDSITGFVNGDSSSVVSGNASLSSSATASSGAGTYTINAAQGTLSAANYTFAFANGTLTVTPAPLTVTANDASKAYGQPNPAFSASYSGFVNGDSASSLGGSLSFSTPATASSPVGSYPITPNGLTSANYAITFANGTLTVTAAQPTVAAPTPSKGAGTVVVSGSTPAAHVGPSGVTDPFVPSPGITSSPTPVSVSSDATDTPPVPVITTSFPAENVLNSPVPSSPNTGASSPNGLLLTPVSGSLAHNALVPNLRDQTSRPPLATTNPKPISGPEPNAATSQRLDLGVTYRLVLNTAAPDPAGADFSAPEAGLPASAAAADGLAAGPANARQAMNQVSPPDLPLPQPASPEAQSRPKATVTAGSPPQADTHPQPATTQDRSETRAAAPSAASLPLVQAERMKADVAAASQFLAAGTVHEVEHAKGLSQGWLLVACSILLSVGYVILNSRAGLWLLSLLTARPLLWRGFDPVDVLFAWEEEKKNDRARNREPKEETLRSLVQ